MTVDQLIEALLRSAEDGQWSLVPDVAKKIIQRLADKDEVLRIEDGSGVITVEPDWSLA